MNQKFFNRIFLTTFLISGWLTVFAQIEFIENKGQWDPKVKYRSEVPGGAFFLEEKGYTVAQFNSKDVEDAKEQLHAQANSGINTPPRRTIRNHAYKVQFVGAQASEIVPEKPTETVTNYFIGDDPSKWVSAVKTYQVITYKNIYPGIDIRYFMDEGKNLKYDLIVHPGARVSDIAMKYTGADRLDIQKKELIVSTTVAKNRSLRPYTYQAAETGRQEVECRYEIRDKDIVRFKVGDYDRSKVLVIDPTQIFFTYSGATAANYGFTATYGRDGSFFGGGRVYGNGTFPTSPGAYGQNFNGGDFDMAIIKLDAFGRHRLYATYIGGSGEDQPHSLIADAQGNLIIAGRSNSSNYPTVPARDAQSGPGGGFDIVVTKLSPDGSQILGSMRIGGTGNDGVNIGSARSSSLLRNYGDDARSEVMLDAAGNIYVASCTQSSNFPTTAGAFQPAFGGKQDGVLLKLNPACRSILFSTFIGGAGNDAAYVVSIAEESNTVYVAGATESKDFPGISASGVIQSKNAGDIDGFVIRMNDQGSAVLSGTFVGTAAIDEVYGLDLDKFGFPYIMGTTTGNMPVENAQFSNPGSKQFIWKMEKDLSKRIYATKFGTDATTPNISPTAFMVDRCDNVYVSGWGGKANAAFAGGNVRGMAAVGDGQIKAASDGTGSDFYFFVMERDARSQLYGTFAGQNDPEGSTGNYGDHVDGGTSRFDPRGYIYQSMCFQHVPGRSQPASGGSYSNIKVPEGSYSIAMLKIEMDFTGVRANLQVTMDGVADDTVGCVPQTVEFKDIERTNKAKKYYWDFGDGHTEETDAPVDYTSHYYDKVGTYRVRLIAEDLQTCNQRDTVYQTIYIGNNQVFPDFTAEKLPPCENLTYRFTNTSTNTNGDAFKPGIFRWDFGDNTTFITNSFGDPVTHTYAAPGTYNVTVRVTDAEYCNSPAEVVKPLRISPIIKAAFETPAVGCAPYQAKFTNKSQGGITFAWDFGDGTTSTDDSPTHLYSNPGTYTITMTASDPNSCNERDQTKFTITVSGRPTAAFNFLPLEPMENVFTEFYNNSTGATKYLWDFGDGETDSTKNPRHVFPATGTFAVCLAAINDYGCADTVCQDVKSLIRPLLDVPNAFTPGKFGKNSTIGVEGFGIQEMEWTIYNRWGQKVFVSNSPKQRWNGTFNGKLLPMDVYTYTLRATFSNGTRATKTGDITLIR